ncbi:MAG: cyclophilin-like fold protein [Alteraurantiacibacter sp.]
MMIQKRFPAFILAASLGGTPISSCAGQQTPQSASGQQPVEAPVKTQVETMKIRLKLENTTLNATLDDNATSRDFVALLPLTLALEDHAQTEKISNLPKKLSTEGAPAGHEPSVGDIAYYAPWDNLAIYHKDFDYSSGLIKLGEIDSGIDTLEQTGPLKVTIERVEK